MPRRHPLPATLRGAAFLTSDTAFHGLRVGRLRGADVQHPFHGVRSIELEHQSVLDRCRAYEPLLRAGDVFSHSTAAELYGIPLPDIASARSLHIVATGGAARPRSRGVLGHVAAEVDMEFVLGLPVVSPSEAWCQLGNELARQDLVAAGDYLISGTRLTGGKRSAPLATLEQLAHTLDRRRGCRGAAALRWALPRLRQDVDSRPESLLRLLCVRARLPEPVVGITVAVAGGITLHPDLAYPQWKVVLEYESDGHRVSKRRFATDIERRELFEAAGWRVIRVTAAHLFGDPDALVRRIRSVIAARR